MNINLSKNLIFFEYIFVTTIVLTGCNNFQNKIDIEKNEPLITSSVVEQTLKGCEYPDGSFCTQSCCIIDIKCGEQNYSYIKCDTPTGVWNNVNYQDSNCLSECKEIVTVEPSSKSINESNREKISSEETLNKDLILKCLSGWKCVEEKYRGQQSSDCSWISLERCDYGCKDGMCKPASVCKPNSLKCDGNKVMKCYEDGEEWLHNATCDYECDSGGCINETTAETTANTTNTTQENNFISDSCISVLNFNYNPAGNNLSEEYFTLKNSCSYSIDISSWTAKDDAEHVYTFPSFNLDNSAEVTIVTGSGSNNSTTLYWGRGSAVWNNGGDTLYLNTSNGTSVLIYTYP